MQDAEFVHEKTLWLLAKASQFSVTRQVLKSFNPKPAEELAINYWGKTFRSPLGLAAGFDKDGKAFNGFFALGFGFVEVGTVTPLAQSGNPKPRLFRLPKDEAVINRMGFNNHGTKHLTQNIQKHPPLGILGINIGKNKETPLESAVDDYVKAFCAVERFADYITINVSSPNTANLRQLQEHSMLETLIDSVLTAKAKQKSNTPILLKIAPDLSDNQLSDIASLLQSKQIDGIIATNTTCSRDQLKEQFIAHETGGLSGKPLKKRSHEIVKTLYQILPKTLPIIGVGGISSAQDACDYILSGASLIQIYTSMIYQGPSVIGQIHQGLTEYLKQNGIHHVQEMIGANA